MSTLKTVYVCDDDDGLRESLHYLLSQHQFDVVAFASGPLLLAALDAQTRPVRGVFLLDVRMDPMSGPQLHDALIAREIGKRNPVVFLTGHGNIPLAVHAVQKGALAFLEKPYAGDDLVALLHQALATEAEWYERAAKCDRLRALYHQLSNQQRRLLPMITAGMLGKQMASNLGVSDGTVEVHMKKLRENLQLGSSAQIAAFVVELKGCGIDVLAEASGE